MSLSQEQDGKYQSSLKYDNISNDDETIYLDHDYPHTRQRRQESRCVLLHPLVGWALVALCVILSASVAALYLSSRKYQGLSTVEISQGVYGDILRLLRSSGPTFVMTIVASGILGPFSLALYLIAPYLELERGAATAENSIMANYAVIGLLERFRLAIKNRKWGLVSLALTTFLGSFLSTAASGLIETQNIITKNDVIVHVTSPLGIAISENGDNDGNGNHIFLSSDEYLASVLFAGGQQLYAPSPVPLSYYGPEGNWSITPLTFDARKFNISGVANLTVTTYGIDVSSNCKMASIGFNDNSLITVTVDDCSLQFSLPFNVTDPRWHFATSMACDNTTQQDVAFNSFVYAVYRPQGYHFTDPNQFVVMFCQPSILIATVSVKLSIIQGVIGSILEPPTVLEYFPDGRNTSDPNAARLLGPPLNGKALNGYDITEPAGTEFDSRTTRAHLTRSILEEGIYGAMLEHMGPDESEVASSWFNSTQRIKLGGLISDFYQAYLNTFSPRVYYNSSATTPTNITGLFETVASRAVVSSIHAALLCALLIVMALLLTMTVMTQPAPRPDSHALTLCRNTIAYHTMASSGDLHEVMKSLSGLEEDRIKARLRYRRFSTDDRGRIVVHNEA